ncbi:sensor domain-containing protein, partial [Candidatus Protofrankia datiscae]
MGPEGDRLDLFDRLQIGMALVGVVDNLVWRVNTAACQILGRGEAELLHTAWDALIHPGERAKRPDDTSPHAVGCRDGQQDVIRFVRPDGSMVHALAITTLLRDGSDPRPHHLVQFQDITREVTARHHLRLLLENAPVTLFLLDRIGRVEHAGGGRDVDHAGASRPSASEALEALGSFDTPRGPDASKDMTSGGAAFEDVTIRRMARRAAHSGKRVSGVIEAAGRRYDIHAVPLSAADGTVTSVAMVATDVTEREQALAELRVRSAEQAIVAELGERSLHNPDPQPLWRAAAQMVADHLRADAVTVHELPPGHAGPCLAAVVGTPPEPGILVTSALATCGPVHADRLPTFDRLPTSDRQDSPRRAGPHNQLGFRDQQDFQDQQGTRNGQGPAQRRDDGQGAPSGGRSGLAIPIGRPDDPTAILTVYRGAPPAASGPPGPAGTFPDRLEGPIVPVADATGTSGSASSSGSSGSFTDREVEFVRTVATVLSAAAIRHQVERDANHRALHDELTGLANRTALFERLGQALKQGRPENDHQAQGRSKRGRSKQSWQLRTGLLFVDLDGFKGVNDSLGHHIGDRLLCEV